MPGKRERSPQLQQERQGGQSEACPPCAARLQVLFDIRIGKRSEALAAPRYLCLTMAPARAQLGHAGAQLATRAFTITRARKNGCDRICRLTLRRAGYA